MCGGYDTDVDFHGDTGAEFREFSFLKNAEQLDLRI